MFRFALLVLEDPVSSARGKVGIGIALTARAERALLD